MSTPRQRRPDGTFARGNTLRLRHGLRSSGLPPSASYLTGQLRAFRGTVRDELEQRGVTVGVYQEALLQSAVRHETRALLAAKWLRDQDGDLKLDDRLQLLATISSATDARDKCLDRLGLDRSDTSTIIDMLYSTTPTPTLASDERGGPETTSESRDGQDASTGTPEPSDEGTLPPEGTEGTH